MITDPNNDVIDTAEAFEALWTVHQVAAYLRASRSLVYQKAASGELPSRKVFGMLRFDPHAIRVFALGEKPPSGGVIDIRSKK